MFHPVHSSCGFSCRRIGEVKHHERDIASSMPDKCNKAVAEGQPASSKELGLPLPLKHDSNTRSEISRLVQPWILIVRGNRRTSLRPSCKDILRTVSIRSREVFFGIISMDPVQTTISTAALILNVKPVKKHGCLVALPLLPESSWTPKLKAWQYFSA